MTRGFDYQATADRGHGVALFLNGSARSVAGALRAGVRARVSWARGGRAMLVTDAYRPPDMDDQYIRTYVEFYSVMGSPSALITNQTSPTFWPLTSPGALSPANR